MATEADEPVVGILDEEWGAIAALGQELADPEWDMPSECPGWSVRDVMAHMIGTERDLLGDPAPSTPTPLPVHVHNDVGAHNEAWVASRRSQPGEVVLDEFRSVTARRLDQLRSWPSSRFDETGPSPVGNVPYREFMHVRVMDCWVHEQDIRVATGRPGHDDGPAARLAFDRLCSAVPFVVGKRAAAPEGASVRFELRGPMARRLDVVVRGGRATTVADLDEEPTAALDMDAEVFWRLACGRVTGPAARSAGLVEVRGDTELGGRVVDALAIMI
jgi:uncharacterized protein (TIGR03083 family)